MPDSAQVETRRGVHSRHEALAAPGRRRQPQPKKAACSADDRRTDHLRTTCHDPGHASQRAKPGSGGNAITNPLQARPATDTQPEPAARTGITAGTCRRGDLVALFHGLEQRLANQPVIEQSTGILIGQCEMSSVSAPRMRCRGRSPNLKVRDISQILITTATANPPGDPRRASQELIDLITCLNKGQIPTATMSSDQATAV